MNKSQAALGPWIGALVLVINGSLWGLTFPLSKMGIDGGIPPFAYGFWAPALSCVLIFGFMAVRGQRFTWRRRDVRLYLITGLLGLAIPNMGYYFFIPHMPSGLAAVILATGPLHTFLYAVLLKLERYHPLRALGVLVGFAGTLLLILPDSSLPSPEALPWVLLAFGLPVCHALNSLAAASLRPADLSSPSLTAGMFLVAAVVQLPAMFIADQAILPLPPHEPYEWAMLGQITASTSAYLIYFTLLPRFGAVFMSQISYIVTVTGILWGTSFFGESLNSWIYAAAAAIIGGVALVNLAGRRKAAA